MSGPREETVIEIKEARRSWVAVEDGQGGFVGMPKEKARERGLEPTGGLITVADDFDSGVPAGNYLEYGPAS